MKKIIIASLCLIGTSNFCFSQNKSFIDQPYIEVNGSADSLVTPNEIFIKIIISEKDTKDRVSVEEQEGKMINALKNLNINAEKDLTNSDMMSNYKFHLLKQKDVIKTKEYMLKVKDANTLNKVFIKLEDIGISNTSIDRVNHTDLESIKNECRSKAIENARKKAIALTKPIGQTIGNAILITDNEANYVMPYATRGVMVMMNKAEDVQESNIQFEKIKVEASVGAKFILK
jgi:hypothetical protein